MKIDNMPFVVTSALSLVSFLFVTCNGQEEFENVYYGLDVSNNIPITRSTSDQFGIEDPNAQTWKNVPCRDNECMLFALIKMATNNRTTMGIRESYIDDNGETKWETRHIGEGYTAEKAYNYALDVASNYKQPQIDSSNHVIEGSEWNYYSGGTMTVSVGLQVGAQLGLLSGQKKDFNSYDEMKNYLQSDEWKSQNHKDGQYLINDGSGSHTVICNGIKKNGEISYIDSEGKSKYNREEVANHKFTIMY